LNKLDSELGRDAVEIERALTDVEKNSWQYIPAALRARCRSSSDAMTHLVEEGNVGQLWPFLA
jgi:hypothetical protein